MNKDMVTATTSRKIGKITYIVCASPSEKAVDSIDVKIDKLIVKDLRRYTAK
jgi:hypothetical protein